MWNENSNPHESKQPELASEEKPDLAALGDALVQSLMNDQFKMGNLAVVPQRVPSEDQSSPSASASMKAYKGAADKFTKSASVFIQQLPLLTTARAAYAKPAWPLDHRPEAVTRYAIWTSNDRVIHFSLLFSRPT
jgi:hypothetical protein